MTPFGSPASVSTLPISIWVPGQISDAFITTVLPQASAIATDRTPRITGAFHGAMPTQTPAGCRTDIAKQPGLSDGITSPRIMVVMEAASRSTVAAKVTLRADHGAVAPVSSIISLTNSSRLASSRSAAFNSSLRRSIGPFSDQAGNAAAAAAQAALTSSTEPASATVATLPVNGSLRSNVVLLRALTSAPSIRRAMFISASLTIGYV